MPQPTSRTRLSSVPCVTSTGSVRLVDINRAAAQTEAHLRRHHHVWLDGEAVVQECPSRRDAWFSNAIRGRLRTESPPGWGSSDGRSAGNAIDRWPQRASAARPTTTVQFTMLSARRTVDANLLIPLGPAVECRKCAHRCHRELAILRLARLRYYRRVLERHAAQ